MKIFIIFFMVIGSFCFFETNAISDNDGMMKVASVEITEEGRLSAGIYLDDVLIRTLYEGVKVEKGKKDIFWDLRNQQGQVVAPGNYILRAVFNNLKCKWVRTVGNTGNPPWGKSKILGGLFNTVTLRNGRMLVTSPTGEFGRIVQLLDKQGQVVWTADILPVHGRITAATMDDKYVYIIIARDTERDSQGRMLIRDVLWRIDVNTGQTVKWGDKTVLTINEPRYTGLDLNIFTRFTGDDEPYPGWNINDLAAGENLIYIPLFREGVVKVMDRESGEVKNAIPIPFPKSVTLDKNNKLWILAGGKIARFLKDAGNQLIWFSIPVSGLDNAWDIEIDRNNDIYVSVDGKTHQVLVFDDTGKQGREFGRKNGGEIKDGDLKRLYIPLGISVDDDTLAVADYGNGRIAFFNKKTGAYKNSVEVFGYGGIDGDIEFAGSQDKLYTQNVHLYRVPQINLTCYTTGISKDKPWKVERRYADINPILTQEPIGYLQKNNHTFIYVMGRFPVWYEIDKQGKLAFCGCLLHPQDYSLRGFISKDLLVDLRKLGLLDKEKDVLKSRITWIDHNRDMRIQENETEVTDDKRPFYTFNDAMVDEDGNMFMHDYMTSRFYKFRLKGFDDSGNPEYSWKDVEELIDLKDFLQNKGKAWKAYGKRADEQGGLYFTLMQGNGCMPQNVSIAKFSKDRKLLWEIGRKAQGLKDLPGEFSSAPAFLGIIDGIVYILEYEGMIDLYTTEGLYLATLLEGYLGKDGPYRNYGENFHGDVIKGTDGNIYFMINCHNYCVPIFRIENMKSIKDYKTLFTVTKEIAEKAGKWQSKKTGERQWGIQYILKTSDEAMKMDGDTGQWKDVPGEEVTTDKQHIGAEVKTMYSEKYLYLLAKIQDSSPAVNKCANKDILWDGDCLELYISGTWRKHSTSGNRNWKKEDTIIHIAPFQKKDIRLTFYKMIDNWKTTEMTEKCLRHLSVGDNSYEMELAIPWDLLDFKPARQKLIGWDWDVCYSIGTKEKVGFKIRWYQYGFTLRQRQDWDFARFIENKSGKDTVLCQNLTKVSENVLEKLPAYIIKVSGSEEYAAYMRTYTDKKNIYFLFDINDPDPAINTAGVSFFYGTGDYIDLIIDGKKFNVPVGIKGEDKLYAVDGGRIQKLDNTSFTVTRKKKSYNVRVTIPVKLFDLKKDYDFNWLVSFSDKSGGAVFRQIYWRSESGKLLLED